MGRHIKNSTYKSKCQTSVNFDEKSLALLRYLKKEGYIVSVSESIREMLNFALPFFIHSYEVKENILLNKITEFSVKAPTPKTIKQLESIQPITFKKRTLEELRKRFPNISDYKFINEK